MPELSEADKEAFRNEINKKWTQPKTLWWLVIACSVR